jgi:hypothetical protein
MMLADLANTKAEQLLYITLRNVLYKPIQGLYNVQEVRFYHAFTILPK